MTWDYFSPIIWSTVEQSVGILCACLPVLGPLLPKSWMEQVGSTNRSKRNRYYGNSSGSRGSNFKLQHLESGNQFSKISDSAGNKSDGYDDDDDRKAIRQTTIVNVQSESFYHP